MLRGLWGQQLANKRPHFCSEWTFALFSGFPPPPTATQPPHLNVGENAVAVRDGIHI